MTDSEFSRIVDFVSERYGIDLRQKQASIERRLENYMVSKGYKSYDQYMNAVEYDILGLEEQNFIDMITTKHTYFYREREHFDFFRDVILPEIKEKENATKNMRIWCAGVSSGEEAYTIAMMIKDFLGEEYDAWDTGLMATDLSRKVLERALKGIYSSKQLAGLPKHWTGDYFTKLNHKQYEVIQEIRKNVMFRQFNLVNPFPFKNKLHVIFLRNVMMYLTEGMKSDLVNRLYGFLEPGGYLIIGLTESIEPESSKLEYLGTSIYKRPLY